MYDTATDDIATDTCGFTTLLQTGCTTLLQTAAVDRSITNFYESDSRK